MSIRTEEVQLKISFLTPESQQIARAITDSKEYVKTIEQSKRAIADYEKELKKSNLSEEKRKAIQDKILLQQQQMDAALTKISASAKNIEKIDLTKVTPAQLTERARQLAAAMRNIPQSAPEYATLQTELVRVNAQMATMRAASNGVKQAGTGFLDGAAKSVKGFIASLGPIALAMIGIQTAFDGVKKLFSIGQDADALGAKMSAVFGDAAKIVNDFANTNANAIGLSRQEYKGLATDVADLLTPMGFTREEAANLSTTLVDQAGKLSLWTKGKVSTQEATEILNKSLLGERDALNSLGIDIKDSTIQQELKRKGLEKLTGESLRQAEALITLEQITKQSSNANEAFAKGTDNLAAKKAKLRAQIAELGSRIGGALVPAFDKVISVLIPVAQWILETGSRIAGLWQRAETLRAVFGGVFTFLGNVVSGFFSTIANGYDIVLSILEGDFTRMKEAFKRLMSGGSVATSEVKQVAAQEGQQLASAFGNGFDAQFAIVKGRAKKGAKELAEETTKAFEAAMKGAEATQKRVELEAEANRIRGISSEGEYQAALSTAEENGLRQRLDIYKRYGKSKETEALEARNRLLAIEQARATRLGFGTPAPLDTQAVPGAVSRTTDNNTDQRLGAADAASDVAQTALRNRFQAALITEQDYQLASLELKRAALASETAILRSGTGIHAAEIQKREEKKAEIEANIAQKRIENEQRLEDVRRQVNEASIQSTAQLFGNIAQFLSADEQARKKNAEAIKAFQIGEVVVSGISEVQKIWASAAQYGPAGPIIGAIQTAAAIARSALALGRIRAATFAQGGFTGDGIGQPDHTGHRPAGIVHAGEYVWPKWMVQMPAMQPILRFAETTRLRGYAQGGFVTDNTTPTRAAASSAGAMNAANTADMFGKYVQMFAAVVQAFPTELSARVAYTDIETSARRINTIRSEAAL